MLKDLQNKAVKRARTGIIINVVLLVILLAVTGNSLLKMIQGPVDLYSLSAKDLKGSYVDAELYAIVDLFAEYTEKSKSGIETVTQQYFIIPVGESEYIGVMVPQRDLTMANRICDETFEYVMGDRAELTTTMPVRGTINKMKDEVEKYFYEWFEESQFLGTDDVEEIKQYALPYILEVDHIGWLHEVWVYICIAAGIVFIGYLVYVLIRVLTGSYVSQIKRFLKKHPELSMEEIELDYQKGVEIESARVSNNYTFVFKGNRAYIIKNEEIIWAYLKRITHKTNGVTTSVTYAIIINTKDRKEHTINMATEAGVHAVLEEYSKHSPHIILGFSDELKKKYKKDYQAFLDMSRRQATEAATRAFVDRGYSNDQYTSGSQTFGQGAVNKVVLEDVGENKIQVIAAVRSFLNCGLKEAKDLVDAAPSVIKENAPAEEAQKFKEELEGLEATVRLE